MFVFVHHFKKSLFHNLTFKAFWLKSSENSIKLWLSLYPGQQSKTPCFTANAQHTSFLERKINTEEIENKHFKLTAPTKLLTDWSLDRSLRNLFRVTCSVICLQMKNGCENMTDNFRTVTRVFRNWKAEDIANQSEIIEQNWFVGRIFSCSYAIYVCLLEMLLWDPYCTCCDWRQILKCFVS